MRTEARFPSVDAKAGHYESLYIKACRPEGGLGVWIRHTVHKRPGEEPRGSIWFVLFDAGAAGPQATKATFPASELSSGEGTYIAIDGASLSDGRATGSISTAALEASWDLAFRDDAEPFYFLPRPWMYRAAVPRTKFLSPYPNASFSGKLSVAGRAIEVSEWPGMIGHNWGSEHAERWVWIQGTGFADRPPGIYFDAGAARVSLGPLTVPWIANGRLVLDGREHRLGGLERMRSTEIHDGPTRCDFALTGSGVRVRGAVYAAQKDFVGWVYADPKGPEHNTLNCSISNLELEVERKCEPAQTLALKGAAAYEIGMRETDHGIPIQPYPDP
jgi:hypothetical protein